MKYKIEVMDVDVLNETDGSAFNHLIVINCPEIQLIRLNENSPFVPIMPGTKFKLQSGDNFGIIKLAKSTSTLGSSGVTSILLSDFPIEFPSTIPLNADLTDIQQTCNILPEN